MKVTHEDVIQMARLSKLYIDQSELDQLTEDMSQIISLQRRRENSIISKLTAQTARRSLSPPD